MQAVRRPARLDLNPRHLRPIHLQRLLYPLGPRPGAPQRSVSAASDPTTFNITSGPDGSPCQNPLPFGPAVKAGSENLQAGAYAPFTLTIAHPDADQPLSSVTMHLPTGMAAMLASVTPCPEPQAANNQCGPDSLIGHSSAVSGLGPEPFTLPGQRLSHRPL